MTDEERARLEAAERQIEALREHVRALEARTTLLYKRAHEPRKKP